MKRGGSNVEMIINQSVYELTYIDELIESSHEISNAGKEHLNAFRLDVYEDYKRIRYVTTRNSCKKVGIDRLAEKLHPFLLKKHLGIEVDEALLILKYTKIFFYQIVK